MLTKLVVENFKAFGQREEAALAPITLVFGGNSAGKSSLIQALLLLRQSLVTTDPVPMQRSADLVVRGGFVDLGSYDALVHAHDREREVTLGLEVDATRPIGIMRRVPPDERVTVEWRYARRRAEAAIKHVGTSLRRGAESLELITESGRALAPGIGPREDIGVLTDNDARTLFRWAGAGASSMARSDGRAVMRLALGVPMQMLGFEDELRAPDRAAELTDDPEDTPVVRNRPTSPLEEAVNGWLRDNVSPTRWALRRVSYLGPMRAAPGRLHILTGERVHDTGTSGEHVVDLLARSRRLLDDVNSWFAALEIPYVAEVRTVSDAAVAGAIGEVHCLLLRDRRSGVEVAPTDVGFGIGQVLPVVVQSLLNRFGTLCIEQPEIHLHPALQARLAELFASVVSTDRNRTAGAVRRQQAQFILETHSEHLILRLQRLIRRGHLTPDDVSVLWVGTTGEGETGIRRLRLDDRGEFIDEWPTGFFDERFDELFGD